MTLSLDTPGSRVNVLGIEAAEELTAHLAAVDFENTRAVVVRSGKPGSFVNGVGLMLANAVKAPEDAGRLTRVVREAYVALRELPVPTIAIIEGNCFGCGVELAMHCQHRAAIDVGDTELYMTEIAEYVFVPVFGATRDLPRLVGLRDATDLLLWGKRLDARQAARIGLVDAALCPRDGESAVEAFVEGVVQAPWRHSTPPDDDVGAVARVTRARIARLPPEVRPAYSVCFDLLERNARGKDDELMAGERERLACGATAMRAASKAAQGFFFVRQMADRACRRGRFARPKTMVELRAVPSLAAVFGARHDADLRVRIDGVSTETRGAPDTFRPERRIRIGGARAERSPLEDVAPASAREGVRSLWDAEANAHDLHARLAFRTPVLLGVVDPGARKTFVEVASLEPIAEPGTEGPGAMIFALLDRVGVSVVRSHPRDRFVSSELVDAFAGPIARFVARRGSPVEAARALRDHGFWNLPRAAIESRYPEIADALQRVDDSVPSAEGVADAVLLSLVGWAREALTEGKLAHPSVVDLMAVDLLGYPVERGGLCRGMTVDSVRSLLGRGAAVESLVEPRALAYAGGYVATGAPFYRG